MAKYGIFGGLAGPWKKERLDKIVENSDYEVNGTITARSETTFEFVTDANFSDVLAAAQAKKNVIIICDINNGAITSRVPLSTFMNNTLYFGGIMPFGDDPAIMFGVWEEDSDCQFRLIPLTNGENNG